MNYRIANHGRKPWPANYATPREAIEAAKLSADRLNERMVIWSQPKPRTALRQCRRIWPLTWDHRRPDGQYCRRSEKIR